MIKQDYKEGDKVIVTKETLHNVEQREFEGVVKKVQNNSFRGLVLTVDAGRYGQFFDVASNFRKL